MAWIALDGIRRSIVCALGVSTPMVTAGCLDRSIDDGDSVGDGDGSGSDDGTSGGSTSGDASESATSDGSDTGPPRVCVDDPDAAPGEVAFCVPMPASGSCGDCTDLECQQLAVDAAFESGYCVCSCEYLMTTCGPEAVGDTCCYRATFDSVCIGRPFIVEGDQRLAAAMMRTDWTSALRPRAAVPAAIAETLAEHWQRVALAEHASVASFARFCLDLMSLGAPSDLLGETQRALADEIEHARLCFALASGYAGRPIGPGTLDTTDVQGDSRDAAGILEDAIIEGCIGETVSAAEATAAAATATDPVVRRVLEKIAADETRHAALAWRFVQWALEQRPELRQIADACFRRACAKKVRSVDDGWTLESYGVLSAGARAEVRRQVLGEIVEPCAGVLVGRGDGWGTGTGTGTGTEHAARPRT